jgi:hypothetical protein
VWTIYFEKSFRAAEPTRESEREAAVLLRKSGLDPGRAREDASEEALLRRILHRRGAALMAAQPEVFVPGGQRLGLSLPVFSTVVGAEVPEESPHQKVSFLDSVQHHTGIAITKIPGGQGRLVLRPGRRTSSLYQSNPRILHFGLKSAREE